MTAAGHEEFALQAEAKGNRESATEAYLLAAMAYHFGCNNSPQDLEEYMPAHQKEWSAMRRPPLISIRLPNGTKYRSIIFACRLTCGFRPGREATGGGDYLRSRID